MKKHRFPLMPVIWGATCLVIGVLVAVGLYSYHSAEKDMAAQFNRQQLILAQQAAQGIESFVAETGKIATLLARIPEVQNLKRGSHRRKQEETLQILFGNFEGKASFIFFADDRGNLGLAYPPDYSEKIIGEMGNWRPSFQKAYLTRNPAVKHVRFSAKGEASSDSSFGFILLAVPIFCESEWVGVLGCGLDFRKMHDQFVFPIRSGTRGESWMIDQEGKFIAHYDPDLLGKDAFLARKERNPNLSTERIDRIMREEMLAGKSGMDAYTGSWQSGERGQVKKLIAYAPIHLGGQIWSVALVVPYSEVTQVVWAGFQNSAVLIFVMACTLLAGTYVGHKINQERIRAEEKVKWGQEVLRSQNRLQALFDGAPDAITIVDQNYRILTVNRTGLTWYQRPLEEFVGKLCHEAFQGRSDLCPNCPAEESFRTGRPAFRERASLVAGGTKHYLQIFTFPLRDRSGEVTEVVEYVKDVTAEKELHQQIIQSERLAVVGRMAANVAHEIRNPLGTIVLNADLLEEELERLGSENSGEARGLLGVIKSELDRLLEVLEEYLQFARLPKVKLEAGQVNEVVSDLLLFLREEATDRKVMVVEELEASLPAVELDAKQLRQALLNIIKNSFDAMPEGGKLTVTTARREGKVEIAVGDTGKGIPQENQEQIFTPFFSTKQGGTGLGLPITSHIIKEHRGTISFQSYLGLGTIFTIRLPILLSEASGSAEEKKNLRGPWRNGGKAQSESSGGEKNGYSGTKEHSFSGRS